ncbi:DUF2953 domain-containing protein [Alicyclobacillus contaminans]|uniref:DUF2953 domain-containing protein n=1 Tax=Alicyclobacillus contaminans TaxID=392016 RepID=UPI00146F953D|nr:DUF2953 domain-containing protein [Alicyclobacillus contaminans]
MILRVGLLLCLVLVVLLALAALLCVHIRFQVVQRDKHTEGFVRASALFGFIRVRRRITSVQLVYSREGPAVQANHDVPANAPEKTVVTAEEVWNVLTHWRHWLNVSAFTWRTLKSSLLRHVRIQEFRLEGCIGLGDAVTTGIAYGALWTAVGAALGRMTQWTRWQTRPTIKLDADFQSPRFDVEMECIATVRAGYLMLTAVRLMRVWRRRTKDGSPNPGTDEDGHGEHSRDGRRQYHHRRSG